jgi:D-tyrosyl-tRNA(Tyr) deacylase
MKVLMQRVSSASVRIGGSEHSRIGRGLLVLLGIGHGDSTMDAESLAEKCVNLRIFDDEKGKMNLSLLDVKGEIMVVSQFTLLADCRRGRRPSYSDAARPEQAIPLYEKFVSALAKFASVKTGVFGAEMEVSLVNDGPVTIMLDGAELL